MSCSAAVVASLAGSGAISSLVAVSTSMAC